MSETKQPIKFALDAKPWISLALIGAAVAKGGVSTLISAGLIKIVVAILLSPLLGFLLGGLLMVAVGWISRTHRP